MNDMTESPTDSLLTAIRVSGNDRIEFLQGQFTQDLNRLTPRNPVLAGWNTAKGRLSCVSWLADWQNAVWFTVPAALASGIAKRLGMFVLRADARVEVSELTVHLITNNSSEENILNNCFTKESSLRLEAAGGWQLGGEATAVGTDEWRLANIRAGLPVIWPETSEAFVPQMVNLDLLDGISFSKGCYVGQEIVARTQNLGRIKRRMFGFRTVTGPAPAPGDVIKSGSHGAGKIVDAAPVSDGDGIQLLAVIRIESLCDKLSLEDGRPLQQVPLPYEVPETVD